MEHYDFIIVGAGSAGCVLADRLTACGRYKVLVIEAGGSDNRFWIKVPLGYGKLYQDPSVNWRYSAEADAGLNNRQAYWPRGKVIGGSSSINAMAYLRGLPHDFDDWEAAGAKGWNWETIKQTYDQLETRHTKQGVKGDGPVNVSDVSKNMHPFSDYFLTAAKQAGWPVIDDLNQNQFEGIAKLTSTVRNGRRWSAADAFLKPARRRENLRIISHTTVEKIIITDGIATGVIYRQDYALIRAYARREVIVSAGAVNSPKILQHSGLGSPAHLKQYGIEVQHELPQVGQGLQDHLGISYQFTTNEKTLNNRLGSWIGQMTAGIQYLLTRSGPLSIPVNQVSGFIHSGRKDQADFQIYGNPMSYKLSDDGSPEVEKTGGFLLCAQPCRPTSCGEIMINSSDPRDTPAIRPNSLSTDEDKNMAIVAGRMIGMLADTPAIQSVSTSANWLSHADDEAILDDFRARAASIYHASCTCRMGQDKQDSVLDSRLRVHGIKGLRVIDASSFPNITSGNTNAPVMMLAARGADMILKDQL